MSATSEAPAAFRHSAARPGPLALIREGIDEILSRRRLVRYLVQADLRKKGADTLLGNIWWVLDPLLQMVVYVIFVAIILQASTPDYPCSSVGDPALEVVHREHQRRTTSVVSQERLIKQIQFPKIVLPVAATTAGVVGFAFGLIALAVIMLFFSDRISINLVFIPVIAVVQYVFTLGMALAVASINVFFRDLGNVLRHMLRLWFYLSPALYSLSRVENTNFMQNNPVLLFLAKANPFAILFESYRAVIYGTPEVGRHCRTGVRWPRCSWQASSSSA
jgi:lipopolysaccharide transport system permease protein/teichoic acid transport system permease protein